MFAVLDAVRWRSPFLFRRESFFFMVLTNRGAHTLSILQNALTKFISRSSQQQGTRCSILKFTVSNNFSSHMWIVINIFQQNKIVLVERTNRNTIISKWETRRDFFTQNYILSTTTTTNNKNISILLLHYITVFNHVYS